MLTPSRHRLPARQPADRYQSSRSIRLKTKVIRMSGQSERLTLSLLWSFMTPLPSECLAHPHHAARSAFRRAPLLYKVLFHIYLQKRESSWTPLMCLTGPPRILYSRMVLGNAKKSAVHCKISATTDLAFGQVQVFLKNGRVLNPRWRYLRLGNTLLRV